MPNKQLTAKVRITTSQAEKSIDNLVKKINKIDTATRKVASNNQLEQQINRSSNKLTNVINKVKSWATAQKQVTQNTRATNSALSGVSSKIKAIAATYLGVMGARGATRTSDIITSAQNRLNNMNGGDVNATQLAMDKMYASANKVRMLYTDMLGNASKSMVLAGDAFQGNIDNAIRFQEIMAETYALGGARPEEMSSSMYQMIQALGSGVLQGDELRSVREGAPLAYKAIEKFAQGVYHSEESLKDMASQGLITADIVVAAILDSGKDIDKQFKKTSMTFEQAWNKIKSSAIKAFEPVSEALNKMLNKAAQNGAFEKIEAMFESLANVLLWVFDVISNAISWIADNWNWLKYIFYGAIMLMIAWLVKLAATSVWSFAKFVVGLVTANKHLLLIIGTITALLAVYDQWKQGTITTVDAICQALLILATVFVIVAAICTAGIYLIFALIVLVAVGIIYYFEEVCGFLAGLGAVIANIAKVIWDVIRTLLELIVTIIAWAASVVINIVIELVNEIIRLFWALAYPAHDVIEWILNVTNDGFNSFGDACANLIGKICSWWLSLGKVVTTIIDAIFGTDWTSGLESLQSSLQDWGKNDQAITLNRTEMPQIQFISPTDVAGSAFDVVHSWQWDFADVGKEANAASEWASGIKDSINQWGSQYQTGESIEDLIANLTNGASSLPNALNALYDTSGAYDSPNFDDLLKNLEDINGDTGKISDSMDLTNEDLDYLRKIAEMEWRNEFTTAEIKVDMTNNNTVNGERDMDGIVEYLSDVLRTEMTNVAYGVHY